MPSFSGVVLLLLLPIFRIFFLGIISWKGKSFSNGDCVFSVEWGFIFKLGEGGVGHAMGVSVLIGGDFKKNHGIEEGAPMPASRGNPGSVCHMDAI